IQRVRRSGYRSGSRLSASKSPSAKPRRSPSPPPAVVFLGGAGHERAPRSAHEGGHFTPAGSSAHDSKHSTLRGPESARITGDLGQHSTGPSAESVDI